MLDTVLYAINRGLTVPSQSGQSVYQEVCGTMAKLLLKQAAKNVGAGKFSIFRLIGSGSSSDARAQSGADEAAPKPFEGLDTTGDTPEALRAELEALRALLDEMRAERARGSVTRATA
jgi:hypothetical protein